MDVENRPNDVESRDSSVERELNGTVSNASTSSLDGIKKPLPPEGTERIKKRAKRLSKQNSREGVPHPHVNGITSYVVPQRRWKNSRRSRNGYGRGLPKKGGAGGKGVWGLPGSELLEETYEDQNDPNYDSECNDKNIELKEVIPEMTPEEFFKLAEPIILEYYEHGHTHEVAVGLDEILTGNLRPYVTSVAVEISFDHKDSQREMTSLLISDLYGRVITGRDIEKGFGILLENLPDLILDTPEAATLLGKWSETGHVGNSIVNMVLMLRWIAFAFELN